MIACIVAGILGRYSGAPPGYVGRHRAPGPRYAAAARQVPAPGRGWRVAGSGIGVPELARLQRP